MIKGTYRMENKIEYEIEGEKISAVDATDLLDYYATAEAKVDNENVNILGASLSVIDI